MKTCLSLILLSPFNRSLVGNILLFFALFTNVIYTYSQGFPELPDVIAPTPAVAELGKYGTYPVSMNTGIPNISFPLFDVSVAEISLPFSLSYHAGGIKVNQEATEVGLGWSISGNMVIHRNVLGTPDEMPQGNFNIAPITINDFVAKYSGTGSTKDQNYNDLKAMADGAGRDTRPDMFNYNIAGKSGQFIYAPDRTYMTFPYEPIKIIRDVYANSYYFTIIDEKGTEYRFRDTNKILINDDASSYRTHHVTDWYITEIVSNTKQDTIKIEYENTGYSKQQEQSQQLFGRELYINGNLVDAKIFSPMEETTYSTIVQEEKRIKRITYRNGEVVFNYNTLRQDRPQTAAKRLDNIRVYDGNGLLVKGFDFTYDYFVANFSGSSGVPDIYKKRLKLTGFSEIAIDQTGLDKGYTFDYNTSISIPNIGNYAQDYWGFFNGKVNNSLIPSTTISGSDVDLGSGIVVLDNSYLPNNTPDVNTSWYIGSANRSVDTSSMQMCILKKITYPTQGYSEFEYEPHAYSSLLGGSPTTAYGGGLRIAKIKNYATTGVLASKEYYKYGVNENGLAEKLFEEELFFKNYDEYTLESFEGPMGGSCGGWVQGWQGRYLGIDVYSAINYNGSPFIYQEVNKYVGIGSNLIRSKYEYSMASELISGTLNNSKKFINSSNYGQMNPIWSNSDLIKETHYKKSGSNYEPIQLIEYTYSQLYAKNAPGILAKERQKWIKMGLCDASWAGENGHPQFIIFGSYQYKSRAYRITRKEETSYLPSTNDALVITNTMSYGNTTHMQLTTSTATSSDGKTTINKMYYPDDIASTSTLLGPTLSSPQKSAVDRLKTTGDLHRLITPVQTEVYSDDNSNGTAETGELVALQRTDYKDWGGALVLQEAIGTLKGVYNSNTNTLQDRIAYHSYDNFGNPIEVSKTDGTPIYYIWGYNSQYPIAKIENFTASQASAIQTSLLDPAVSASNNDSTEATENTLRTKLNDIRNSIALAGSMVTTYTYDPLIGVTSMTDPKGYTVYYEYDEFNRLKQVKDAAGNILNKNEYHYKGQL